MPHVPPRILDITLAARNQVNVAVKDSLARSVAGTNADVETHDRWSLPMFN